MRRKFIAAVTSGVLALTVMAALPTHAEAVSIWLDLTPGTESGFACHGNIKGNGDGRD